MRLVGDDEVLVEVKKTGAVLALIFLYKMNCF